MTDQLRRTSPADRNADEQLREPERRITRNLKSTSTAAARLRWSLFGKQTQRVLPMGKQHLVIITVIALAVMAAIIAYQQIATNRLRVELASLSQEQADHVAQQEDANRRILERDARHAMRAICNLAEFARSELSVSGEQVLTIRSAEFELLHFARNYIDSPLVGAPMTNLLLSDDEQWQQWHIHGEYYSTLKAVSIALEAAKTSKTPHIAPDGEIRYLLERISRWLTKYTDQQHTE